KGKTSQPFEIREDVLPQTCLSDLIYYFKIQRCSGVYDKADRCLRFFGEPDRAPVDAHGGWYDASGDVSKYLSHQSEANYMNPQQSPLVVWAFLESIERLQRGANRRLKSMIPMLTEEALYGADFLVRMQDPSGYFYASVMDACTHDPAQREICGYKGLAHTKHGETHAAFREGGGMTIAALARISTLGLSGDYAPEKYLAAAETGFAHLRIHNLEYVDDHCENILDDYCALFAATELYAATQKETYLDAARLRAESLSGRIARDEHYSGWWRADDDGSRPFFHATDAGLPVVALLRYEQLESDPECKSRAHKAVLDSLRFELKVTDEVVNPFGYARQYVKDLKGGKRAAFFFPHDNETGYWWVGENARLASLAAASLLGCRIAPSGMRDDLKRYALNQLNWILGLNPFDMCMLQGKGHNNPADYEVGSPSPPGGICNGVTSGVEDEQDIAYLPEPYGTQPMWSWRWKEQWIPHSAWLILALTSESASK
ncbi:MAG: glycoside hydrolase family 9 protein, partial [Verrucomicrobia bacterium]|nr:glycoside hydrolase family 9 protein [Verrucomicrobiota bacterium]